MIFTDVQPATFIASVLSRLALLSCWLVAPLLLAAEPVKSAGEYQIKAVFLYNFAKFVDWPGSAFATTNSPLVIGVVGTDPFGRILDDAVKGEIVRDRPLVIRRFKSGEPISPCHILFIGRSERDRLETHLENLQGKPLLTVADFAGAAERGVMVNFIVQDSVRMEINLQVMKASRLEMSSKLLTLARIVESGSARKPPASP